MKTISLTQGKIALVDDEDYDYLNQWKWHAWKAPKTWYAHRNSRKAHGRKTIISMHREILKPPAGMVTDHKDHNGLNNRKSNLRAATYGQNMYNQRMQTRPKSSRFKGVSWLKARRKWQAFIQINRRGIWLGYFGSELKAVAAYDAAASHYFGEFACVNF